MLESWGKKLIMLYLDLWEDLNGFHIQYCLLCHILSFCQIWCFHYELHNYVSNLLDFSLSNIEVTIGSSSGEIQLNKSQNAAF